jgi:hypothetical protein
MNSSNINFILILLLAMFAALYLGITSATAQIETVIWVFGAISFTVCLLLGKRIYLLIPLLTSSALVLPLPGTFSSGFISHFVFIVFAIVLILLRRLTMRIKFTELEFWMLIITASVIQAYVRNPVGLNIFGSGTIGAKPYAVFAMSTICAALISNLVINPKDLKLWTYLSMAGSITNFIVGVISYMIPSVGYYLGATFMADVGGRERHFDGAFRVTFVRNLSHHIAIWVSSRKSPLTACFSPKWLPLILFGFTLAALSGYRAQLLLAGLTFFVGVCYQGGLKSVILSFLLGWVGLLMLMVINTTTPLPLNIQRSLSVIPGTWDKSLMKETSESSDWRVEMWIEALTTDRWIRNKFFGDGLGFTKQQFAQIRAQDTVERNNSRSRTGLTEQQESFLINSNYHSGPVHTIRTIGYVGLVILLMAMIRLAVHAHRQIQRCKGTEWYSTALFLGIPLIVTPVFWTFVIGTFEEAAVGVMMGIAIIRLLEGNIPLPAYTRQRNIHYGIPAHVSSRN